MKARILAVQILILVWASWGSASFWEKLLNSAAPDAEGRLVLLNPVVAQILGFPLPEDPHHLEAMLVKLSAKATDSRTPLGSIPLRQKDNSTAMAELIIHRDSFFGAVRSFIISDAGFRSGTASFLDLAVVISATGAYTIRALDPAAGPPPFQPAIDGEKNIFDGMAAKTDYIQLSQRALRIADGLVANKPKKRSSGIFNNILTIMVYTGTFDPPHPGHASLVHQADQALDPDVSFIIPNFSTPHKPGARPYGYRRQMSQILFKEIPNVVVGDPRLELAFAERGSVEDAFREVNKIYPHALVYRIMGDDSFSFYLEKGRYPERMVILMRPRSSDEAGFRALPKLLPLHLIPGDTTRFASKNLRPALERGEIPDVLPKGLREYIEADNRYVPCGKVLGRKASGEN